MLLKKSTIILAISCLIVHWGCNIDTNPASSETGIVNHHLSNSNSGQMLCLAVGDTFSITLQTIGPGMYGTPVISNSVIQFLSDSLSPLRLPAGPTQVYLFRSTGAGNADISITHSGNYRTFSVTCKVREG
jgi:hypothetical protein